MGRAIKPRNCGACSFAIEQFVLHNTDQRPLEYQVRYLIKVLLRIWIKSIFMRLSFSFRFVLLHSAFIFYRFPVPGMEGIKAYESFDSPIPAIAGFCSFVEFNSAELWLEARIRKCEILKLLSRLNARRLRHTVITQHTTIVICKCGMYIFHIYW